MGRLTSQFQVEQRADSDTCQPAFSAAKTFGPAGRPVEFAVRDGTYAMTMTGRERPARNIHGGRRGLGMIHWLEPLVGAPGGRRQVLSDGGTRAARSGLMSLVQRNACQGNGDIGQGAG